MKHWSAQRDRGRGRRGARCAAARARSAGGPARAVDRLARGPARRPVRRPAGRARRRRRVRGRRARRRRVGRARRAASHAATASSGGAVLVADDPLPALQRARDAPGGASSRAHVIGVTGSVGKTSTKDLIAALLAPHRARRRQPARTSTPRSGCRSTLLAAPAGTEVLVLEMAMRGFGQIAELARDRRARRRRDHEHRPGAPRAARRRSRASRGRRRELLAHCAGGTAVVPAGEPLLEPYLRDDLDDRHASGRPATSCSRRFDRARRRVADRRRRASERVELELPFDRAPQARSTCSPRWPPRGPSACDPSGRVDVRFCADARRARRARRSGSS